MSSELHPLLPQISGTVGQVRAQVVPQSAAFGHEARQFGSPAHDAWQTLAPSTHCCSHTDCIIWQMARD